MYLHEKILTCFSGLIGFEDTYNADVPLIDEDLRLSRSGQTVNRLHDLLTYENLMLTATQFGRVTVRPWSATLAYKPSAIVSFDNKVWMAIRANTNTQPVAGDDWKETTLLSSFLRQKYNQSVLDLISSIFTEKKLNEQAKTLLSDRPLYVGQGYINNAITKTGAFRGLELTVKNPDTLVLLRYLGLQLTQAQVGLKVYIYHSSSVTPIRIIVLNQASQITFQWHKLTEEMLMQFQNLEASNTGGYWYIGIYDDDLEGSLVEKQMSLDGVYDCGSCTDVIENQNLYSGWKNLIRVKSFHVEESDLFVDNSLFDRKDMIYDDVMTPGINLQFSVQCDLTQVLCMNNNVFTDALSQQLIVNFLKSMAFTLRNNVQHEKIAQLAALALGDNDNPGETHKLDKSKRAISVDLSGLSRVCSTKGIAKFKQKSVWSR